jgi:hypothetical protein
MRIARPGSIIKVLDRLTARHLAMLFLLPFAYGTVRQILKASHWFTDFEAVSCSAQALNAGHSLYTGGFVCPGASPTDYVYTPDAAWLFARLQQSFGITFLTAAYGGIYFYIAYRIFRALLAADGRLRARAPFLAVLSASALTYGNISVVIHGLIFLGIRLIKNWPILLLLIVVPSAALKPTFSVYIVLFLFFKRPIWQRLALAGAGVVGIAGYFAYFRSSDPLVFGEWQRVTHFYGLVAYRGHGFLGLPYVSGVDQTGVLLALYCVFAAVLLSAGLIVATHCLEREEDRLALGIAVCVLLYPRLSFYDGYTLPFGLAAAVGCFERFGRFEARHLALLVQAAYLVCAPIGGRLGGRLVFDFDCILLLFLATMAIVARHRSGVGWLKSNAVQRIALE